MTVLWVLVGKSNINNVNNKECLFPLSEIKKCIDSEINSCVITGIIELD